MGAFGAQFGAIGGRSGARHRREWAAARVGEGSEGDCHQQRKRVRITRAVS